MAAKTPVAVLGMATAGELTLLLDEPTVVELVLNDGDETA